MDSDVEVATDPSEGIKTRVFMEDSNSISQTAESEELSFICQRNKPELGKMMQLLFFVFLIVNF